jgi:hypothetical protein
VTLADVIALALESPSGSIIHVSVDAPDLAEAKPDADFKIETINGQKVTEV